MAWAFSVAMLALLYALCSSRIGRTLIAIRQNEDLVRAQGISPMPYKLSAFAISAAAHRADRQCGCRHLGGDGPDCCFARRATTRRVHRR